MTLKVITAKDQTRIADLIIQHELDMQNKQAHFDTWDRTGNETNRELWQIFRKRCEAIQDELLTFGIDYKAAHERKIDSLLATAA